MSLFDSVATNLKLISDPSTTTAMAPAPANDQSKSGDTSFNILKPSSWIPSMLGGGKKASPAPTPSAPTPPPNRLGGVSESGQSLDQPTFGTTPAIPSPTASPFQNLATHLNNFSNDLKNNPNVLSAPNNDSALTSNVATGDTVRNQQKAAENLHISLGSYTPLKIPFVNGQVNFSTPTILDNFLVGAAKFWLELPERIVNSAAEITKYVVQGKVPEDPIQGQPDAGSYIREGVQKYNQAIQQGFSEPQAITLGTVHGVATGLLDVLTVLDLGATGFLRLTNFNAETDAALTRMGLSASFTKEKWIENVKNGIKNIQTPESAVQFIQDNRTIARALHGEGISTTEGVWKMLENGAKKIKEPLRGTPGALYSVSGAPETQLPGYLSPSPRAGGIGDLPREPVGFGENKPSEVPAIPKDLQPLAQEAQWTKDIQSGKYANSEEFVKAQGEPLYHGTDEKGAESIKKNGIIPGSPSGDPYLRGNISYNGGISLSRDKSIASSYAGDVKERIFQLHLSPNAKIASYEDVPKSLFRTQSNGEVYFNQSDAVKWARSNGYDGIDLNSLEQKTSGASIANEVQVWNKDVLKTKSQLTDFYNQATKGSGKSVTEITPQDSPMGKEKSKGKKSNVDTRAGFVDMKAPLDMLKESMDHFAKSGESKGFASMVRLSFVGIRDAFHVMTNQLGLKIETLVNDQENEALTFYRYFKNHPDELTQFEEGTHPFFDELVAKAKANDPTLEDSELAKAKEQLIERTQEILTKGSKLFDLVKNPTDAMKTADEQFTKFFTDTLNKGKEMGFLDSTISPDQYITGMYAPAEGEGAAAPRTSTRIGGKIGRSFKYSAEKKYPSTLHAMIAGLEPKTLRATDILSIYGDRFGTAYATHSMIDYFKGENWGKWGFKGQKSIPEDWVELGKGSNLFRNIVSFMGEDGKPRSAYQGFYVPQVISDALSPIINPSGLSDIKLFRVGKAYQVELKVAELSISLFHWLALKVTALNQIGPVKLFTSQLKELNTPEFNAEEIDMVTVGGQTPIQGNTIEIIKGLHKSEFPTRGELIRAMPGIHQFDQLATAITKHIFDINQRFYKVNNFALKKAAWIAKHPEATESELFMAKAQIAANGNGAFGGLNWEVMGVRKLSRELAQAFFLAPDWTFSNVVTAGQAFKFGGNAAGSAARAFWLRSFVYGYALTQGTSLLLTGQTSPDPFKVYLGKDKNGKLILENTFMKGAPGDLVNLATYAMRYGAFYGFGHFIGNKANAFPRAYIELTTNRNYLGQEIIPKGMNPLASTARGALNFTENVTPIPFSLQNFANMYFDPNKEYTPLEYAFVLFGSPPQHVVPSGEHAITSGKRKGQLAPDKPRQERPFWEQVKTGKVNVPSR